MNSGKAERQLFSRRDKKKHKQVGFLEKSRIFVAKNIKKEKCLKI